MHADSNALPRSAALKPRRAAALILAAAAALAAFSRTAVADEVPYFYVVNTGTRMMAEVLARRLDDGAPVVLWPNYGGASQQFSIQRLPRSDDPGPLQDQWFLLRARHSGKCLKTNSFRPGATVVQESCSGDASQLWRLRTLVMTAVECPTQSRCFMPRRTVLENFYGRGRCMDAANGPIPGLPEQGNTLLVRECIAGFSAPNAANQEWELVDVQAWDAPFNFR